MIFDILKFLKNYNIHHTTSGNRSRRGWVQINPCPFCGGGERGFDLGVNIQDERVSCWRCGGKHIVQTIRQLLRCSREEAERVYTEYQSRAIIAPAETEYEFDTGKQVVMPHGSRPLCELERHKNYLLKRRFDPDKLEKIYGLMGTEAFGEYKFRIIAPITFQGRLVSYQGRDITGLVDKSKRYKACAMADEAIHHKHLLYGWDQAVGESCVVIEGITDQWRLGPGSLGTFGTGFKTEQANLLVRRFKRVFVLFDPEPQAQLVAEELGWYLAGMGKEFVLVDTELGCDPGDMTQDDADAVMRELGLPGWR